MKISLLAAYTKNKHIIGAQGKIPWNLPSERDYFKKICKDKFVIMGRKTFDEIGKPLSYCKIIVLSSKNSKTGSVPLAHNLGSVPPVQFVSTLEDAFAVCKNQDEILVAGGQTLYDQTIDIADKIYATEIQLDINGDAVFPLIDDSWERQVIEKRQEKNINYEYVVYTKKITSASFHR